MPAFGPPMEKIREGDDWSNISAAKFNNLIDTVDIISKALVGSNLVKMLSSNGLVLAAPVPKLSQNQLDEIVSKSSSTYYNVWLGLSANVPGSATTQCGFTYHVYPVGADLLPENRLPSGATSPAVGDYRGHTSVGRYVAAPLGSIAAAFNTTTDGTDTVINIIAWKEIEFVERCA